MFNLRAPVWGVHFREKVLNLWKNPLFSFLGKFETIILAEPRDEFQWQRGSTTLFFDYEFHESRKWGLKSIFLILSTTFTDANEHLCATRIEARTTTTVSKCKIGKEKRNNFPLIPGENTSYALCMLPQKGKPPPEASNQIRLKGCFVTFVAWIRTYKDTSEQFRSSLELCNRKWEGSHKKALQHLC